MISTFEFESTQNRKNKPWGAKIQEVQKVGHIYSYMAVVYTHYYQTLFGSQPSYRPLLHVKKLVVVWSHYFFSLSHLLVSFEKACNQYIQKQISLLLPPPLIYSRCGCPPSRQEQPSTTEGVWSTAAESQGTTPTSSGTPPQSSSHTFTFPPGEGSPATLSQRWSGRGTP